MRMARNGFSLIELSIALAIMGLIVAGGLVVGTSITERQAAIETANQMDSIEKAIAAYVSINGRLPCPADPASLDSGANHGVEIGGEPAQLPCSDPSYNGSAPSDLVEATGTGGRMVWIGSLPVRTLGLRDRFMADEYGSRYVYAVTENMTTTVGFGSSTLADSGAITVQDSVGTAIVTDAAYYIYSPGSDREAAYNHTTTFVDAPCSAGDLDNENCDRDAVFRDTRYNDGNVAAQQFDDIPRWRQKHLIDTASVGSSNTLWSRVGISSNIYNTDNGNVGIGTGTTAATASLEIERAITNGTDDTLLLLDSANTGANSGSQISWRNSAAGFMAGIAAVQSGTNDGSLEFRVSADGALTAAELTGANTAMRINNTGNIGIGLTNPNDSKVSIYSSTSVQPALKILHDTNGSAIYARALGGQPALFVETEDDGSAPTPGPALSARFNLASGISGCFIGRDTRGLDCFYDNDFAAIIMRANSTNANKTGLQTALSGNNSLGLSASVSGTTSTALIASNTNGGSRSCSIGTATHAMNCTGNVVVSGDVNAATFTPSDVRLKKDIAALEQIDGLKAILRLRPVHYFWKDPSKSGRDIGFIAQEVENIFPDIINEFRKNDTDKTAYKAIDYSKLTAPIVLAIQQLASLVETHDARIKALQAENAALKARLEAIEKKLATQ